MKDSEWMLLIPVKQRSVMPPELGIGLHVLNIVGTGFGARNGLRESARKSAVAALRFASGKITEEWSEFEARIATHSR